MIAKANGNPDIFNDLMERPHGSLVYAGAGLMKPCGAWGAARASSSSVSSFMIGAFQMLLSVICVSSPTALTSSL